MKYNGIISFLFSLIFSLMAGGIIILLNEDVLRLKITDFLAGWLCSIAWSFGGFFYKEVVIETNKDTTE